MRRIRRRYEEVSAAKTVKELKEETTKVNDEKVGPYSDWPLP